MPVCTTRGSASPASSRAIVLRLCTPVHGSGTRSHSDTSPRSARLAQTSKSCLRGPVVAGCGQGSTGIDQTFPRRRAGWLGSTHNSGKRICHDLGPVAAGRTSVPQDVSRIHRRFVGYRWSGQASCCTCTCTCTAGPGSSHTVCRVEPPHSGKSGSGHR